MTRPILIGVAGGVAAALAYWISRVSTGYLEGAAYIAALFLVPVTLGLVIATTADVLIVRHRGSPLDSYYRPPRRVIDPTAARVRCGSCRRWMSRVDTIWVCAECDGMVIER